MYELHVNFSSPLFSICDRRKLFQWNFMFQNYPQIFVAVHDREMEIKYLNIMKNMKEMCGIFLLPLD